MTKTTQPVRALSAFKLTADEVRIATDSLARMFGAEYGTLDHTKRVALVIDWHLIGDGHLSIDDEATARADYATNIGRNNLERYAECVAVWVYAAAR